MSQSTLPNPSMAAIAAAQRCQQQLQSNASAAWYRDQWWQSGTVILAVLATLLAVLPCIAQNSVNLWVPQSYYRIGLVLVGLSLTIVVGVSNRLYNSNVWASLAAGVAAIDRAIYLYRTGYQHRSDRDLWLIQQVSRIQQQTQERLGGNWVLRSVATTSDSTETDTFSELQTETEKNLGLVANEYLQQRLVPQLKQSEQQLARLSATRAWYQAGILICAGLVVVPPVVNPDWIGWSTIPAIFGLALLFWVRTTSISRWLEVHSHLLLGLTRLRDYWQSLPTSEQTELAFFRLVDAAETLIESPYRQIADQLQEAIDQLFQENEPSMPQLRLAQPGTIALKHLQAATPASIGTSSKPQELTLEKPSKTSSESTSTVEVIVETHAKEVTTNGQVVQETIKLPPAKQPVPPSPANKRGRPHAFVVMPFGRKKGPDGKWIDFNSIYQTLIKPAIEEAGFESFRADEEASSGDILTDMFQELLLADLVVADLSIDNANVFYELGIRHAFRRRGVVHIQAGRAYMPFDIITVRTLPYHCDDNGCPDPKFMDKDKQALSKMIQSTWISERNRVHSPIFNLLTGLIEPDRKTLRTPQATGYWQEYTTLQSRIAIAQRQKRIGDVVLLAEEVSNPLIKEDIITDAGKALTSMGNSALALKQYRQGLKINPENIAFRCAEAFHLNRLGQSDEAIVKLEGILQDVPDCVDATNKLARIYKDLWKNNWIGITDETQRIRVAYESSFLLQKSIENYLRGYRLDQNEYYSGINALTLTALLDHLAAIAEVQSGDVDEENYRNQLPALKGTIQFCLESSLLKYPNDQWAALSMGDLAVCVKEKPHYVATAYRKALALLWNNKFALQSTLDQLKLMQLLNFRPEHVQAGIAVLQGEIDRFAQQEQIFSRSAEEEEMAKPAQVFLFSGHMIDHPQRAKPRFPAAMEAEATRRLNDVLNKLQANANCTAILPGLACGGDILFVEACLERKMRVEIYLPFEPAQFVQDSVGFASDKWVERFHEILNHTNVTLHLQTERLGAVPTGDDPYERNNRWALYTALMHDIKRIRLIALWNGQGGDGLGGTADMVQQVRQVGGVVEHLDITKFDYWREQSLLSAVA